MTEDEVTTKSVGRSCLVGIAYICFDTGQYPHWSLFGARCRVIKSISEQTCRISEVCCFWCRINRFDGRYQCWCIRRLQSWISNLERMGKRGHQSWDNLEHTRLNCAQFLLGCRCIIVCVPEYLRWCVDVVAAGIMHALDGGIVLYAAFLFFNWNLLDQIYARTLTHSFVFCLEELAYENIGGLCVQQLCFLWRTFF